MVTSEASPKSALVLPTFQMRGVGHHGKFDDLLHATRSHTWDLVTHAKVILDITAALRRGGGGAILLHTIPRGHYHCTTSPRGTIIVRHPPGALSLYAIPRGTIIVCHPRALLLYSVPRATRYHIHVTPHHATPNLLPPSPHLRAPA